ncbi:MAG: DUF2853 family protein [Salibacteraceae bacterium]
MSKYEEMLATFKEEMEGMGLAYQEEMYHGIVDHLGPSIYDRDAALVACSDDSELQHIKEHFIKGKLGVDDDELADKVIQEVCHALGESNRNKHRPTFYYLVASILQKGEVFFTPDHLSDDPS